MEALRELFATKAPRWLRVIRWREIANSFAAKQTVCAEVLYLPGIIVFWCLIPDQFANQLFWRRPKTQEEFDAIQRRYRFNNKNGVVMNAERNFGPGQYPQDMPPYYDMAVRRKHYPEYYAGRYDGFDKTYV